ncbi:MAG: NapC/NirT family cytochrome c, partial [Candidatus Rokubacteria bacterium]|nr:NapC/NirT family cytochrome c [Candidatus Rokubacteria bacterium]
MSDSPPAEQPRRRRWWRRRWGLVLGGAVVVLLGAFAGLWEVSSSPVLCNSCHIMKPYVDAWKTSKHNQVACVQCHYPPGL